MVLKTADKQQLIKAAIALAQCEIYRDYASDMEYDAIGCLAYNSAVFFHSKNTAAKKDMATLHTIYLNLATKYSITHEMAEIAYRNAYTNAVLPGELDDQGSLNKQLFAEVLILLMTPAPLDGSILDNISKYTG